MTNHEVDAWYCFMIIGRRPDEMIDEELQQNDDVSHENRKKLFSSQPPIKRQRAVLAEQQQQQPRTYIYLARNPQHVVNSLNNGESIREEDGVELTVELANLLNEKRKLNIASPSGSSASIVTATIPTSFSSIYSLAMAAATTDQNQSLEFVGRSVPFVLPAPETIVLPPLCVSRLNHSTLAVDQLETIHIARELEYTDASVEDIRQRLLASTQYLQQQYYQQQQRKRYQSLDTPAPATTTNGISEDPTAVPRAKKETHRKSADSAVVSKQQAQQQQSHHHHHHHHHHHGNLNYKLGMVVGPLLLRKSARLFATLWGIKSRGQISRASLGEDLAGWMALDMFADLTLILSGDRPLKYHALLQSIHGDVWLVELTKKEQLQEKLAVVNGC